MVAGGCSASATRASHSCKSSSCSPLVLLCPSQHESASSASSNLLGTINMPGLAQAALSNHKWQYLHSSHSTLTEGTFSGAPCRGLLGLRRGKLVPPRAFQRRPHSHRRLRWCDGSVMQRPSLQAYASWLQVPLAVTDMPCWHSPCCFSDVACIARCAPQINHAVY